MNQRGTIFRQIFDDRGRKFSVVVDEENDALYAYLYRGSAIVGDVWLANLGQTPALPEWQHAPEGAPYRNPVDYVRSDIRMPPLASDATGLVCEWHWDNEELVDVEIKLDGRTYALLTEGSTPGWSLLAAKDGPLAKPLGALQSLKVRKHSDSE